MAAAAVVAALAALLVCLAVPRAPAAPVGAAQACGLERWSVKTLSDSRAGRVDLRSRTTSVLALTRRARPMVGTNTPRLAAETVSYRVRAKLVEARGEDDGDIHLVLAEPRDPSVTMIAELPSSNCLGRSRPAGRRRMVAARRAFEARCGYVSQHWHRLGGNATLSGVLFFDLKHGQTGLAPNGAELHPLLSFRSDHCAVRSPAPA